MNVTTKSEPAGEVIPKIKGRHRVGIAVGYFCRAAFASMQFGNAKPAAHTNERQIVERKPRCESSPAG